MNPTKGFVGLTTKRQKGLSVNKSIRPIIDISDSYFLGSLFPEEDLQKSNIMCAGFHSLEVSKDT